MTGNRKGVDSSDVVVCVSDIGKCYQMYERPQDRLKQAVLPRVQQIARFVGFRREPRSYFREFWALRGVSFEVRSGDFFGIIGRNGAGKSTLLQIIAGTLTPTAGSVEVFGRVAALLELGSGFSPDFTGRENIYLNAALFGLSREETDAKFDEIAAFADIGEFIDQPVKNYSSGMQMRLAFAVQTSVQPRLLIVDEALAVGDIFFQAKCMARLRKLREEGVTLLFVSHDIGTVRQLCNRAILLERGQILAIGSAVKVADRYMRLQFEERNFASDKGMSINSSPVGHCVSNSSQGEDMEDGNAAVGGRTALPEAYPDLFVASTAFRRRSSYERAGNGRARIQNVIMFKKEHPADAFGYGDIATLRQVVLFRSLLNDVNIAYKIRTPQGVDVVFGDTRLQQEMGRKYLAGHLYVFDWTFQLNLMHGHYTVMSALVHPPAESGADWRYIDIVPISYEFSVGPRQEGMIDGLVVWPNDLRIEDIGASASAAATTSIRKK